MRMYNGIKKCSVHMHQNVSYIRIVHWNQFVVWFNFDDDVRFDDGFSLHCIASTNSAAAQQNPQHKYYTYIFVVKMANESIIHAHSKPMKGIYIFLICLIRVGIIFFLIGKTFKIHLYKNFHLLFVLFGFLLVGGKSYAFALICLGCGCFSNILL